MIDAVEETCTRMTTRLGDAKARTRHLIGQTSALQQQRQALERRQKAVDEFIANYTLADADKSALLGDESRLHACFSRQCDAAQAIRQRSRLTSSAR